MRKLFFGLVAVATILLFASDSSPAAAVTGTGSFTYSSGTGTTVRQVILDSGLIYIDGCIIGDDPVTCFPDDFPGTFWGRIQAGLKYTPILTETANFSVTGPDNPRQDTSAAFTTTLTAIDGSGKEVKVTATPFVVLDLAYDAPLANCSKDTVTLANIATVDTSGCLNAVYHSNGDLDITTFDVVSGDTIFPYSGSSSVSSTTSTPELDLGALFFGVPDLVKLRLDIITKALLTAGTGYTATRSISGDGSSLISGTINWPNAGPQTEMVAISCTVQAGSQLSYALTNIKWAGTVRASLDKLNIVIVNPISDITIPISIDYELFNTPFTVNATPDFNALLGTVQAENKAPTVGLGPIPTNGKEGSPIAFSVVGTGAGGAFDNCDASGNSLSYHWLFDDSGEAFGKAISHTFVDNNGTAAHSGHVVVTDKAGNSVDLEFSVPVANVAPTVDAGPATKTVDWGVPVTFNSNGSDAGAIDNTSLLYSWDFGDGTPPAGNVGPTVTHAFAQPGTYTVTVTVKDKDGATGTDTVMVTVNKRTTTTSYTGPTNANPRTPITLTAQVTDNLGQPVVGRTVTFTLGTQTASGVTDAGGVAKALLALDQKPDSYPLTAAVATDGLYIGSASATVQFIIGNARAPQ